MIKNVLKNYRSELLGMMLGLVSMALVPTHAHAQSQERTKPSLFVGQQSDRASKGSRPLFNTYGVTGTRVQPLSVNGIMTRSRAGMNVRGRDSQYLDGPLAKRRKVRAAYEQELAREEFKNRRRSAVYYEQQAASRQGRVLDTIRERRQAELASTGNNQSRSVTSRPRQNSNMNAAQKRTADFDRSMRGPSKKPALLFNSVR